MRSRTTARVTGLALAACLVSTASAEIIEWNVSLSGAEEVPPVDTPATGQAMVTLDTDTCMVTVDGTFKGLLGDVTAAHIHGLAPKGETAGVILGLTVTGDTSGTFFGSGILSDINKTGMLEGLTYLNVHSMPHPGGEIRGQIPAPATLALLGVAAFGARRRRR